MVVPMTTNCRSSQSRARLALTALASSALLAAAGALAPALVTPANAAASPQPGEHRVVHRDPRHDVLRFDIKTEASRPAPRDRGSDIVRTVVDHQAEQVVLQARVRQLSRSGYRLMIAEILASDGRRYQLTVDYAAKPIGARVSLARFASSAEVSCPGATWSIDRSADRIDASVPTSCLGDPKWIRVGIAVIAAPHDLKTSLGDDSRTQGRVADEHLRLGPRQPRA